MSDYKPLRCKLGIHHWHYSHTTKYNHILRCALCGKLKIIPHTTMILSLGQEVNKNENR